MSKAGTCGVLLLLMFIIALRSFADEPHRFRVVTYNVENLFDTIHDESFNDYEFLPTAERGWTSLRYRRKLAALCRTLVAASGEEPAALIALCEVENDSVVRDLCQRTRLKRLGYDFFVTHSRDSRGIDVALLYQPFRFQPISASSIRIPTKPDERPTRDILHVCGCLPSGDTLDVLVCHLPSRRGNAAAALRLRQRVAETLRDSVRRIVCSRPKAAVIVTGDFNDEATDKSIRQHLGAACIVPKNNVAEDGRLYVLSYNLTAKDGIKGSYKYKGAWNQLDQMIVSTALLDTCATLYTRPSACRLFCPNFLIEQDNANGGVKPKRTYLGTVYHGGVSDHLPLITDFYLRYRKEP